MQDKLQQENIDISDDGFTNNVSENTDSSNTVEMDDIADTLKPGKSHSKANSKLKGLFDIDNLNTKWIAVGSMFMLLTVGAITYVSFSSNTQDNVLNTDLSMYENEHAEIDIKNPDVDNILVDSESGVLVNGVQDKIVTAVLDNYVSKDELMQELGGIEAPQVSKAELDVFLMSVRNNGDNINLIKDEISKFNAKDHSDDLAKLSQQQNEMLKTVSTLIEKIEEQNKRLIKNEKNLGWAHSRITKLNGRSPITISKNKAQKSRRSSSSRKIVNNVSDIYEVRGASQSTNSAFILNKKTNKPLRVTKGFHIPGCGKVVSIETIEQKVVCDSGMIII